jgi:hypothetical protein
VTDGPFFSPADELAVAAGVDARFALAVWTPAFGPLAFGPVGRLSLSALVANGARHGWRGMGARDHSINR